ncbi:glycosyltransferase [Janibacter sp. FSL W8-0316]|uniref:glycosyltransferase n=1 Tax=Janibacter sp. FSL W8-0316 TaxID=2975325 RepID=UPI0030F5D90F
MIRALHVVVPARNEEVLLPEALASIDAARRRASIVHPEVMIDVTVVLDRSVDGSASVVRRAGVRSLSVDHGNVGAARRSGATAALRTAEALQIGVDDLWLASTDADTVVPPHWLVGHIDLSRTHDAVIGTVEPRGLTDSRVLMEWRARHHLVEGHPHVHGANLGLRASTYLAIGGFRAMASDEDVDLVRRIRAHTPSWVATDTVRVSSSARRTGRCHGGFAEYLTDLEDEVG